MRCFVWVGSESLKSKLNGRVRRRSKTQYGRGKSCTCVVKGGGGLKMCEEGRQETIRLFDKRCLGVAWLRREEGGLPLSSGKERNDGNSKLSTMRIV